MRIDNCPPCYSGFKGSPDTRDGKPWCTPHDSPRRSGELCDFMVGLRQREEDRVHDLRMQEYEAARAWEAAESRRQQAKENQ